MHAPASDHVSTRLTHTLEVASIARAIARGLAESEAPSPIDHELVEAIALAHDVGHPPFGHVGESILARLAADAGLGGFHHAAFGVRLLSRLECDEKGVPIVEDALVIDGILAHSKGKSGAVFARGALKKRRVEALVVRAADLYAYAAGDFADACRLGALSVASLPDRVRRVLGESADAIRDALVERTVAASSVTTVALDDEAAEALEELRALLYERVYEGPLTAAQDRLAEHTLVHVWRALATDPSCSLARLGWRTKEGGSAFSLRDVLDAIACMTDRFALEVARGIG